MKTQCCPQIVQTLVCLLGLLSVFCGVPAFCQAQKPQLVVQVGHTGIVNSVAFSPDGKIIASGSEDHTVKIWDTATGQLLHTLIGHTGGICSVAFCPDGRTLASASDDNTTKLWNVPSGKLLRTFTDTHSVFSVAFSPDGKILASGGYGSINIWDIDSGNLLNIFHGHTAGVSSVCFSPDGKTIASGSADGTVRLWDIVTSHQLYTITSSVEAVSFSPDGKTLASASWDHTVKLWDVATGQMIRTLIGHTDAVKCVCFSPDGRTIASGSNDKTVKIWNVVTGQLRQIIVGYIVGINSVCFGSDGKILASSSWTDINLTDVTTHQALYALTGHTHDVKSVFFSPDGRTLYGVNYNLYNRNAKENGVKVWNTETGQLLHTLREPGGDTSSVFFSPEGRFLASGSKGHTIKLWDAANGKLQQTIALHTGRQTGHLLHTLVGRSSTIGSVAFSRDGKTLASDGGDKTIRLWNTATGELRHTLIGHTEELASVCFSADGRTLASASWDRTIKLWDATTGQLRYTLSGHTDAVVSVCFNSDGRLLASGSKDGTIKLWETATGQEIATLYALGKDDWAVVSPDGRFDASPGGLTQMHYVVGLEPINLAQLKNRYYEPGLLAKLLGFNKEPLRDVQAFDHVDLTPEVKAPDAVPADGRLPLTLTNRGGGIGRVQVFVNGKELVADARGSQPDPTAKTAALTVDVSHAPGLVPGKPNTIRIVTWNAQGYLSSRGTELAYTPPGRAELAPPDLWAIVGGISDYAGPSLHLTYPAKDAADFAHALTLAAKNLFGADKVHLTLLDTGGQSGALTPTKANLRLAFQQARKAKPGDIFVVYLAGHGVALPGTTDSAGAHDLYCYLTQDATTGSPSALGTDATLRQATTVSSEELTDWIKQVPAQKQVMVLDTCAAGAAAALLTAKRDIPSDQIRAIERLKDRTGFYVLMGCAADAVSYETSQYRQGLLTYSLLKGMKGASLRDGQYVDVSGLFNYAVDAVPQLAQNIGGVQRPFVAAPEAGSFDVGELSAADRAAIPLASAGVLLLRPELVPDDEDLHLEELLIAQLRAESTKPRGDADASAPSFVDATGFPGAIQARGNYSIVGGQVSVTLKLRRDGLVVKTLTVTGGRDDLPGLVAKLATAILGAIGTP